MDSAIRWAGSKLASEWYLQRRSRCLYLRSACEKEDDDIVAQYEGGSKPKSHLPRALTLLRSEKPAPVNKVVGLTTQLQNFRTTDTIDHAARDLPIHMIIPECMDDG